MVIEQQTLESDYLIAAGWGLRLLGLTCVKFSFLIRSPIRSLFTSVPYVHVSVTGAPAILNIQGWIHDQRHRHGMVNLNPTLFFLSINLCDKTTIYQIGFDNFVDTGDIFLKECILSNYMEWFIGW